MSIADIINDVRASVSHNGEIVFPSDLETVLINQHAKDPVKYRKEKDLLYQSFKNQMHSVKQVDYKKMALGYALGYMPRNIPKVLSCLIELGSKDLIPSHLEVLDVGAATGTSYFALNSFIDALNAAHKNHGTGDSFTAKYTPLEKFKDNVDMFHKLNNKFTESGSVKYTGYFDLDVTASGIKSKPLDLVIFSNMLCELSIADRKKAFKNILKHLKDDGSVIVIETADPSGSSAMRSVDSLLKSKGYNRFSPNAIWTPDCAREYCNYCYFEGSMIEPLGHMNINRDNKFSYGIYRKDGESRFKDKMVTRIQSQGFKSLANIVSGNVNAAMFRMNEYTRKYFQMDGKYFDVFNICDGSVRLGEVFLCLDHSHKLYQDICSEKVHSRIYLKNLNADRVNGPRNRQGYNLFLTPSTQLFHEKLVFPI